MYNGSKLAVLTRAGSKFGIEYLERLRNHGIRPSLIGVEYTTVNARIKMLRFLAKKIGWYDAIKYNIRFWKPIFLRWITFGKKNRIPDYSQFTDKLVKVKNINDKEMVEALSDGITTVILAQSGIIRRSIINIPGLAIINCHPGIIPYYRGVDVVKWALLEREPIGITLHLVDEGIDTGEVLQRIMVPINSSDSIEDIEERSKELSLILLVEATRFGIKQYLPETTDMKKGKQYYLMPFKKVNQLKKEWDGIIAHYTRE